MTVSSLINPPQLDVDIRDDIGNILQEEISPLGEVAELVDSDKSEVDGEVDNDSLQQFFVQYYCDCFVTLCEVLGECLAEHDYSNDFLVAVDLEGRESEETEVVGSLDTGDVAGLADRTRASTFTKMLVSKFVKNGIALCLAVFVTSLAEMVLDGILAAEFNEVKEEVLYEKKPASSLKSSSYWTLMNLRLVKKWLPFEFPCVFWCVVTDTRSCSHARGVTGIEFFRTLID